MIYRFKKDLANSLGIQRQTIAKMVERGEVVVLIDDKQKRLGYAVKMELIKELLK